MPWDATGLSRGGSRPALRKKPVASRAERCRAGREPPRDKPVASRWLGRFSKKSRFFLVAIYLGFTVAKTFRNLWPQVVSWDNLVQAYRKCHRGKQAKPDA